MYSSYNYGLEGQIAAYDNFFGKKKREERKAKREEKKEKKEERTAEREERRDERKDQRKEKRELKNKMKEAEIEEKKLQSAALFAISQDASKGDDEEDKEDEDKEASGLETTIAYIALGVIVVCAAGYFMLSGGKRAALAANAPNMKVNTVANGYPV